MRRITLILALVVVALANAQPRIENGASLVIEKIPSDRPPGLFGVKIEDLKIFGEKKEGAVRIVLLGSVTKPGIYFLKDGVSLAGAIDACGGFGRLATSRFSIIRKDTLVRLVIGSSHGVASITPEVLPFFRLQQDDVVFVQEVSPY